jgi:hypothetical protein
MKLLTIAHKIKIIREQAFDLPEYIYHVSPYTKEIMNYGTLVPSGMGAGDDFGRGFGGGVTKGISFFSDIEKSKDYANGIMLAIMLANVKDYDSAINTFGEWAKIQEDRLGVNLNSVRDYFVYELDRYYEPGENILTALKSVRQLVTIKASRISSKLDDPVIFGSLSKFTGIDISDIGIIVVKTSDIPSDAKIASGTDLGEIRISGVEIPIYKKISL